jgi:peptide/nickel transport system permease protein
VTGAGRPPARLIAGAALTGGLALVALLSRVWTPESPTRLRIALRLKPPGTAGLLGTDALGRDILSMLMAGAGTSLGLAVPAVLCGAAAGTAAGLVAAAREGWTREAVMGVANLLFAFPALLSGLIVAALLGPGGLTAVIAIGLFTVPVFARLSFDAGRRVWLEEFCLAAALAGKGQWGITRDHVLPGIAGVLAVQVSTQLGFAILIEAGLSYLGLSVPPPTPGWGRMLNDAQTYLAQAPWLALAPGAAIVAAVGAFNLLGDGLRDWLDPRTRPEHQ